MVARGWVAVVAAVATVLPLAGRAGAQTLHGAAELQYQSVERVGSGVTRETWGKTFETDYSRLLPGAVNFASRFRFTEQTVAGQRDRLRVPEGSLRFAHRYFGFSTAYRPSESRDAGGLTTSQQNLALTANAQKPGLPSLAGSWIRNHLDPSAQAQGTATVTRSLSANYTVPRVGLHAGYGDRSLEPENGQPSRIVDRHGNLGAVSQFELGRAPITMQYDFTQARANPSGARSQLSRSHTAGATSALQLSAKTASSLTYTYRHTRVVDVPGTASQDHNGALSLSHALSRAFALSSGAGLRSASFGGRTLTERFVNAGASAQGQARPGWRVGAGIGRTYNWLPGAAVRVADNVSSNTAMRLARGLDANGDLSLSASRRPDLPPDSSQVPREIGLQFGGGIVAVPLRSVHLDASVHRSQTGTSLGSPVSRSTFYASALRLSPSPRTQMSGNWSMIRGGTGRSTSVQTTLLWSPSALMQFSGSYGRSTQTITIPAAPVAGTQENFAGSVTVALGRHLTASFRYSEAARGLPTHLRQVSANVVQRFGR